MRYGGESPLVAQFPSDDLSSLSRSGFGSMDGIRWSRVQAGSRDEREETNVLPL